jgi:hypothetical protein
MGNTLKAVKNTSVRLKNKLISNEGELFTLFLH